jgi:hypothetical protein
MPLCFKKKVLSIKYSRKKSNILAFFLSLAFDVSNLVSIHAEDTAYVAVD